MSRTIIGIDLGTTFSLAAVVQDGKPIVLPNALGETLTPSAVAIAADGMTLVGAAARAMATTHPERTALSFKRDMGTDRVRKLAGKSMTAPELSALVLGTLKRDAEATLGKAVDEAVVTVPAYFGDLQRQADLGRSQADAGRVVHGLSHPFDQPLDLRAANFVRLQGPGCGAQHRGADL